MWTRKHYHVVAKILKAAYPANQRSRVIDRIREDFSAMFQDDNWRFSSLIFMNRSNPVLDFYENPERDDYTETFLACKQEAIMKMSKEMIHYPSTEKPKWTTAMPHWTACGKTVLRTPLLKSERKTKVSNLIDEVTCKNCKRTKAFSLEVTGDPSESERFEKEK